MMEHLIPGLFGRRDHGGCPGDKSYFFVGRTKEGFSMNKVMNGYAGWAMERQMAIDVIPILADGLKWMGYLPKQRIILEPGCIY